MTGPTAERVVFTEKATALATTINDFLTLALREHDERGGLIIASSTATRLLVLYATLICARACQGIPKAEDVRTLIMGAPWDAMIEDQLEEMREEIRKKGAGKA